MIEVTNLTKYYGEKPGVVDLSFTVQDGEVVGLLGPNGAGKSTLMKMLTGYHLPTSGGMKIDGIDAIEYPKEAMAKIGFMPEIPPLYVDMTVQDFLMFCAKIRGAGKKDAAEDVAEVMELASITDVSGRLIRNLSKGYRQRVGLAQALIGRPEILIMDEPTVGLDPRQMAEFRQLILKLGKSHTVIVSSHILAEISQICTRLLIINKGRLIADGSVEDLEDRLRKGDSFLVRLKADGKKALSLLSKIDGVTAVHDRSDAVSDNAACLFSVEAQNGEVREKLFRVCAENDMPILELSSDKMTLEQVFLRLTNGTESVETEED